MRIEMSRETSAVPYQLQQIIDSMLNKKDNVYLRSNYRARLGTIRAEIDTALKRYDNELFIADTSKGKKKRA